MIKKAISHKMQPGTKMNDGIDKQDNGIHEKEETINKSAEVVHLCIKNDIPIDADHAAEYLAEILSELRGIAASANLKLLAALIEVAIEEARLQSQPKKSYAGIA